ncbi:MAG: hypothetical protein ACLFVK_05730, partial [Dehalococcoidia bacterium]
MSNQDRDSLQKLLDETGALKQRMEQSLPSYIELLQGVSALPGELSRRYWASCVEALLRDIEPRYHKLEDQARQSYYQARFISLGMSAISRVMGMQPMPPPDQIQVGISLSPSGEIDPDWIDGPEKAPDAIFVGYNQFLAIAQGLKGKLMRGEVTPSSEGEIPKLLYG